MSKDRVILHRARKKFGKDFLTKKKKENTVKKEPTKEPTKKRGRPTKSTETVKDPIQFPKEKTTKRKTEKAKTEKAKTTKKNSTKTTSSIQSGKPTEFDDYIIHGLKVGYSNKQIRHFALVVMYLVCHQTRLSDILFDINQRHCNQNKKRNFKTRVEKFFVGIRCVYSRG